jgi:hypothetical protein
MVRICRNCDGYADGAASEPDSRGSGVAIECPENCDGYSVATVWFCLLKLSNPRPNVGLDSPNFLDLGMDLRFRSSSGSDWFELIFSSHT